MPRFFSTGAVGWISQVPIISSETDLDDNLIELVNAEIIRIVEDERMTLSLVSRVVTITARRIEYHKTPFLTLRFNILNREPIQFAYFIGNDGKKLTITRHKDHDHLGINA